MILYTFCKRKTGLKRSMLFETLRLVTIWICSYTALFKKKIGSLEKHQWQAQNCRDWKGHLEIIYANPPCQKRFI